MKTYRSALIMVLGIVLISFTVMSHSLGGGARSLTELWQHKSSLLLVGAFMFLAGGLLYLYDKYKSNSD